MNKEILNLTLRFICGLINLIVGIYSQNHWVSLVFGILTGVLFLSVILDCLEL